MSGSAYVCRIHHLVLLLVVLQTQTQLLDTCASYVAALSPDPMPTALLCTVHGDQACIVMRVTVRVWFEFEFKLSFKVPKCTTFPRSEFAFLKQVIVGLAVF